MRSDDPQPSSAACTKRQVAAIVVTIVVVGICVTVLAFTGNKNHSHGDDHHHHGDDHSH